MLAKNEAIGPPVSSQPTIFLSEEALAWPSLLNIQMKCIFWGDGALTCIAELLLTIDIADDISKQITSNNLIQSWAIIRRSQTIY